MPFTSTQISGLVGGQQVMFSNQAAFANQIGGLGNGPQQMMANPYPSPSYGVAGLDPASPDIGTRIAGGAAMSMGGIAAGTTMAASLLGYKSSFGLLDPFTGMSRAFGAGTGGGIAARAGVMAGAEGMGVRYAASNISGAFARGGLGAGMGAIGGGLAGAAAAAVPYYVAGKALSYVGENVYSGVQNVQDVRRMASQYMEPQYGQPGAGMGGRSAPGMIKQMTSFMHELASEDTMTSMKDMRQLMDKAGQMGMLQGIGDVNQFRQRFRDIVRKTKSVAQILGTTLDEALPLTQQLTQMGMWTAKDVMGTAAAIKAAGPGGAQALMGSVQQGAQMSYQMGGKLESGARLGQELFGQVGAATRAGIFTQQDIRNFTGGVGGAEGQRMVAGGIQQVFAGFGQSAMGRMMMAGLGQVKDGRFTGQMDEQLLGKFNRGEIGVGELQSRGQKRVNQSQEMAASFFNRADQLGQEMSQKGGMTGMAQGIQQALLRAGKADAPQEMQNRFIQLITGANQRQADMIQKIIKDLPRIQAEQERATSAALEDSFRQLDERRNRSFAGLSDAISHAMHEGVGRPLQELGENFATSMSEATDSLSDKIMGRSRAIPQLGVEQQLMLARAGALQRGGSLTPESMGIQNSGRAFMQGGTMENLIGRIGEQGFGGRLMAGAGIGAGIGAGVGAVFGGVGALPGAAIGAVIGGTEAAFGVGETESPRMRALQAAGLRSDRPEDAARVARQAFARTVDPTMGGLLGGETSAKRDAMETVKARMREVYNDPANANRLRKLGEESPGSQFAEISRLLKNDPKARAALETLEKSSAGGGGAVDSTMNVVTVAQAELGYTGKHAFDPQKLTKGLAMPTTPEEIKKFREENISMMTEAAGGFSWEGLGKSAAVGGLLGAVSPLPGGTAIGAVVGAAAYMLGDKISRGDMEAAMASKQFLPSDIAEWVEAQQNGGKLSPTNRFAEALSKGDASAQNVQKAFMGMDEQQRGSFLKTLKTEGNMKDRQLWEEHTNKLKAAATAQGPILAIKGVSQDATRQIESARKSLAAGDVTSAQGTLTNLASTGQLKEGEIQRLLSGAGGVAGQQAGRLARIQGLKSLSADQAQSLLGNLGGVNMLADSGLAAEVEDMLAKGHGKITGSSLEQLKKDVTAGAAGAMGAGATGGAKSAEEDSKMKYIAANERFVWAVGSVLGDKVKDAAQDLKGSNPVAATP